MPLNNPRSGGPNHVAEYQLSGIPYVLEGEVQNIDAGTVSVDGQTVHVIEFPRVTRWIYIKAAGAINIYFSSALAGPKTVARSLKLANGQETPRMEWRAKKLYIHEDQKAISLTIWAGLTAVGTNDFEGHVEHFTDNNNKIA